MAKDSLNCPNWRNSHLVDEAGGLGNRSRFRGLCNALLVGALCVFLCGPFGLLVSDSLGVTLPSWLSSVDAAYLSGSGGGAGVSRTASLNQFLSGEFQAAVEGDIDSHIPLKAACMLGNAAMQRKAISLSNIVFKWDCYPTFYGSQYALCPEDQCLFDIPDKKTEAALVPLRAAAEALERFGGRNPSKRAFLYLVPDNQNIPGAPVAPLVANALSYPQMLSVVRSECSNAVVIDGGVSYDQFLEGWYRTDHHWNIQGAYAAYTKIAQAMGLKVDAARTMDIISYGGIQFRGTLARRSLDDSFFDVLTDIKTDSEQDLLVSVDGGETGGPELLVRRDAYDRGWYGGNRFTSHYGEYFNFGPGLVTIRNTSNHSGSGLLVIADSFSSCLDRFFAENYEFVYMLDPRNSNKTANQLLDENESIVDVLVLMCRSNFVAQSTINALV